MGYGAAAGAKGGRAYIRLAVERSLRRLRTDYGALPATINASPTANDLRNNQSLDFILGLPFSLPHM